MRYQKIYYNLKDYGFTKDQLKNMCSKLWIAYEKIHGSNFSIVCDGSEVKFAKRNGILTEDEWFYDYHLIKEQLQENAAKLYATLNKPFVLYGELCGGWYPADVNAWKGPTGVRINDKNETISTNKIAVQEGVYYSHNIEFITFDLAIYEKDLDDYIFFDHEKFMEIMHNTKFKLNEPLLIAPYEQMLDFKINTNSKLPKHLGMGELKEGTNIMEGIVVKPYVNIQINGIRPLIKIKNANFKELSPNVRIDELNRNYKHIFHLLLNRNRFDSVLSKNGLLTKNNHNIIVQELIDDIWADCYTACPNITMPDYDTANDYLITIATNYVMSKLL